MVFRGIGGYHRMGLIRLSDSCIFIFFSWYLEKRLQLSSAEHIFLFQFGIGCGMCELSMRVGEMTFPCGTPLLWLTGFPKVFPNIVLTCVSFRKLLSSLQSGLDRLTSKSL